MSEKYREILGLPVIPIPERYCARTRIRWAGCRAPRNRAKVYMKKESILVSRLLISLRGSGAGNA